MEQTHSVNFTPTELKSSLKQHLSTDNENILLDAIIGCLGEDSNSMSQLAKALIGIRPIMEYSVGDEIMVRLSGVGTWQLNKDLMIQQNMIDTTTFAEDSIKCTVIDIKPYKAQPYEVEYTILNKDIVDPKPVKETSFTWANYIYSIAEEWPLDD